MTGEWRDIKSAPKDGTRILIWVPNYGVSIANAGLTGKAATLWQPIPKPPTATASSTATFSETL